MTDQELIGLIESTTNDAWYKNDLLPNIQVRLFYELKQALRIHNIVEQSEQLGCDTCIFNTHSWSEDYPCATCCNFDKHKAT